MSSEEVKWDLRDDALTVLNVFGVGNYQPTRVWIVSTSVRRAEWCGLDCSNFVSHLLKNAGLKSKFATTATLLRENERVLWKKYAFIDVGNQLEDAKPGDLILKNGHVVMLIDIQQPGYRRFYSCQSRQ